MQPNPSEQSSIERQQIQEQQYKTPYHWFWTPASESGRSYFYYLSRVAELIPKDALSLLDVGCGDGRGTSFLKDVKPAITIIGGDYSTQALFLAENMSKPRDIGWRHLNLYDRSGFGDASFDVVTAVEVLEHLPPEKLTEALCNIKSSLAPNGSFILTVPSILAKRSPKHYQHFSVESISE